MKHILLIEDNKYIRENTVELLELEGYKVVTANNGLEGLTLAKQTIPALILCDIHMPEMNGYTVIKMLKAETATAAIPFVFITASAEKSEVEVGLKLGADDYLRKPFEEEELLAVIARLLNK
ncbi:MAG: response regulator [Chitinophagales bacterium]|nr:response regulator [Chitinophagales bacterium]